MNVDTLNPLNIPFDPLAQSAAESAAEEALRSAVATVAQGAAAGASSGTARLSAAMLPPGVESLSLTFAAPVPSPLGVSFDDVTASLRTTTSAPAGYATSAAALTKSSTSSTKALSSTTTKKELAFLDDKTLSVEEKLFRFMALMTKKADQELLDAMKGIAGTTTAAKSTTAPKSTSTAPKPPAEPPAPQPAPVSAEMMVNPNLKPPYNTMTAGQILTDLDPIRAFNVLAGRDPDDGGSSALDKVVDTAAAVGEAVAPIVKDGAKLVAEKFTGPAAAAVVTAFGLPELAPAALAIGNTIGGVVADGIDAIGSDSGPSSQADAASASSTQSAAAPTKSASSSSSSASASGEVDEKLEMLNLQRLVEKQNAMFAALSNVMKSIHDSQMAAVQNIR